MKLQEQTTEDMRHIASLIKDQRFAMLTTMNAQGLLESKPMSVLELDAQGRFWFFTHDDADRPLSGEPFERLNLAFSDEDDSTYVSVSGTGELVHDRERMRELWTPAAKPWFPQGVDSPGLALLRVTPQQAEYWDSPSSKMVRLMAMAASVVAAKPIGLGEHAVLKNV